ncbi:hypothetical protein [Actinokineospora sp. NBRC 105648]|uniref:hypothetical protein n=1 Tax=Actinokineospora sp. NBRC 105648 TaxID=3032206 RepID=UPI0024A01D69|nr:hypothetical protein [Actinokineospora sp. NBRC 105648]GLZ43700.1 hypothetical protein Acsp05_73240 [Actinokineospora sp. NBRC 105648]
MPADSAEAPAPGRAVMAVGTASTLLGVLVLGIILWIKQQPRASATRAALRTFLPDAWFAPDNTIGESALHWSTLVFVAATAAILTLTRRRLARGAPHPSRDVGVYLLTLVRAVIPAEGFAVYCNAQRITDPTRADLSPGTGAQVGLPVELQWVAIGLLLLAVTVSSAHRELRRVT